MYMLRSWNEWHVLSHLQCIFKKRSNSKFISVVTFYYREC